MASSATLAQLFNEMAAALELTGANMFRVRAHEKVARVIEELPGDVTSMSLAELMALDGIGEASAKKIREFAVTGAIAEHQELWRTLPRGLLEVMKVPGLGPKTVKTLWEQGGVLDLASLSEKLENGSLTTLPRLGEKTLARIRDAIAFMQSAGGRIRLGDALPIAEAIVELLRAVPGAARVEYAGSLRRGRETIGDIDILASGTDLPALGDRFVFMPRVESVLAHGPRKCSVRLRAGVQGLLQVDLRLVDEPAFGAALLYFTGSKEHNVALRERALARGLTLNEYGLFPNDDEATPPQARGVAPVAAATEESICAALELPWMAPDLREDRGELTSPLPTLIELADIKAELHAHTTASDGALSILQLALAAIARGFHTIAVTDHSRSSPLAGGLTAERLVAHITAIREVQREVGSRIRILAGSEVDILVDGSLDYDHELLAALDIVVASPHASLRQEPEKATARLIRAVRHPLVHILGHPTGRLINAREGLSPDINALIEAAHESGTALEINSNDHRLDLRDTHVRAAVDRGCLIAINCDVHGQSNFDLLRYGVMTARRGRLTAEQCLNAWSAPRLLQWLAAKRP